jgi:hypothetical protein
MLCIIGLIMFQLTRQQSYFKLDLSIFCDMPIIVGREAVGRILVHCAKRSLTVNLRWFRFG